MKAVLTRVSSASVVIDGKVNGEIGKGFLILLGIGPEDTKKDATKLAEKLLSLRVFTDEAGKMNLGLEAVDGQVLVLQDMLGITQQFKPRFLRLYGTLGESICSSVRQYIDDVKNVSFPNEKEQY